MAKKPSKVNTSLTRKKKAPAPKQAPQAFNDVSPITAKQIARAERGIDNLRQEVKELRARKPEIKVESSAPQVKVDLPPRPRIGKVTIKYDPFGMPQELIPEYVEG